jgi:hypothetical protein
LILQIQDHNNDLLLRERAGPDLQRLGVDDAAQRRAALGVVATGLVVHAELRALRDDVEHLLDLRNHRVRAAIDQMLWRLVTAAENVRVLELKPSTDANSSFVMPRPSIRSIAASERWMEATASPTRDDAADVCT